MFILIMSNLRVSLTTDVPIGLPVAAEVLHCSLLPLAVSLSLVQTDSLIVEKTERSPVSQLLRGKLRLGSPSLPPSPAATVATAPAPPASPCSLIGQDGAPRV